MYVIVPRATGNPKGLKQLSANDVMQALRKAPVKVRPVAKKLTK